MPPTAPIVSITFDRERHMRLDFNALARAESITGKSALDLDKPSATQMRALLWACLVDEDPALTIEQVGSWIHLGNLEAIKRSLDALTQVALPEEVKGANGQGPLAPSAPTGSSSRPSPEAS